MKRSVVMGLLAGAGALALTTAFASASASPESLLPPGFDDPAPAPRPAPRPAPAPRPVSPSVQTVPSSPSSGSTPVIQPLPGGGAAPAGPVALPKGLPSLEELEELNPDELDELLGLKPKYDMPPGARRSIAIIPVP